MSPDVLSVSSAAVGAVLALIGAWWNSWLSEYRERKKRLEDERLKLYLKILGVIKMFDRYVREKGRDSSSLSIEDQLREIQVLRRLELLGSKQVICAYHTFRNIHRDYLCRSALHIMEHLDKLTIRDLSKSIEELIREMRRDCADSVSRPISPWECLLTCYKALIIRASRIVCRSIQLIVMTCRRFLRLPRTPND